MGARSLLHLVEGGWQGPKREQCGHLSAAGPRGHPWEQLRSDQPIVSAEEHGLPRSSSVKGWCWVREGGGRVSGWAVLGQKNRGVGGLPGPGEAQGGRRAGCAGRGDSLSFPAGAPAPEGPGSEAPPYVNIPVSPSSKTQLHYMGLELPAASAGIQGGSPPGGCSPGGPGRLLLPGRLRPQQWRGGLLLPPPPRPYSC